MMHWFLQTIKSYPELAIFIALAGGFWLGPKQVRGFSLGNVTATLLVAIAVGWLVGRGVQKGSLGAGGWPY